MLRLLPYFSNLVSLLVLFSYHPLVCAFLKLELLLGLNAKLGLEGSKLLHVLLVESIGAGLDLETLKDADGGRVVVDAAGGLEGSLDDGGGGDEIVTESVVQATLELEEVINVVKELNETLGEVLKGLLLVLCRVVTDLDSRAGGEDGASSLDAGGGGKGTREGNEAVHGDL